MFFVTNRPLTRLSDETIKLLTYEVKKNRIYPAGIIVDMSGDAQPEKC